MKELLKKLTNAKAISGYEKRIRPIIKKELEGHVDSMETDALGNLIVKKGSGFPVYLINAHMDEIGFIVKYIDENGFIKFIPLGGFWDPSLIGQRVEIYTKNKPFSGSINIKHPFTIDKTKIQDIKWQNLFIDIGALTKEDTENIKVSDQITFEAEFRELLNNNVQSKSMDDRAGCAVLIELLKELNDFQGTVYGVFTAQEEVGLKGGAVTTHKIQPDLIITIDVTYARSHKDTEEEIFTQLNKGPVIEYLQSKGRGLIAHSKSNKWITTVAQENNIPIQLDASSAAFGGMTDAASMQTSGSGFPAISIGIPCRNIHTSNEIVNLNDLELTKELLLKSIKRGYLNK